MVARRVAESVVNSLGKALWQTAAAPVSKPAALFVVVGL